MPSSLAPSPTREEVLELRKANTALLAKLAAERLSNTGAAVDQPFDDGHQTFGEARQREQCASSSKCRGMPLGLVCLSFCSRFSSFFASY
jgi:hypothetical protein